MCFCVKIIGCIKSIEPNSIDIMCSLIIEKYIDCPSQYESLSVTQFSSFYNIKKKRFQKIINPKLLEKERY